jgi:ABC-type branched-subunit amino acid transport system substrate-binding protein
VKQWNFKYSSILLFLCVFAVSLSACRANTKVESPVGGLWEASASNGEIDWKTASLLAQEQHAGFELANEDAGFVEYSFAEGNRKDDVQMVVRTMVEGQQDPKTAPVVAILGGTTNEATTRAASLANFFNVPMIVPSASGDNLLPTNNLWAFQLSAPDSAYADYILGSVLTKQVLSSGLEDGFTPEMRIAIFYEQNTYGESAAVATATQSLKQEFEVVVYEKFDADDPDASSLRILANEVIDLDAQVVFVMSSNPVVAQEIVKTFTSLLDSRSMPVMIGMAGGFTSQEFLESGQAERVYVLRQQMSNGSCPKEVNSLYSAQSYAAVKLLEYAIEESGKLDLDLTSVSIDSVKIDSLSLQREAVRDELKEANLELPCLGRVAFDNNGQNKHLRFEIIETHGGKTSRLPMDEFVIRVKQRLGLTNLNLD